MKKFLFGFVGLFLGFSAFTIYAQENPYISYNEGSGLITVYAPDFSYGITLQDKNLGAENVGDTGYYYQRGNNNPKTQNSNITNVGLVRNDSYNNHGYDGEIVDFVVAQHGNVDSIWEGGVLYNNVWGGGDDNDTSDSKLIRGYDTINHRVTNVEGRQGPCESGYHIPSAGEWNELLKLNNVIMAMGCDEICSKFEVNMKLPRGGAFDIISIYTILPYFGVGEYWSSSQYELYLIDGYIDLMPRDKTSALSVRCFKNNYETPNLYTIDFNSNGGENISGSNVLSGNSIELPGTTREYYTFSGWYTEQDSGDFVGLSGTIYTPTDNITLYAQWLPEEYTITYELDNGVNSPNNVTGYTIETPTITLENPTKDGYSFEGWFTDTQFTTGVTTIPTGTTGYITLYAKWTPVEYAITYELDGGTNSENNTGKYTIETPDITLENATKDCYNFSGWFTDAEFTTGVTTIPTGTTGDITLYAKWTKIETKPSGGSSGGGGRSKTSNDEKDTINNPSVTDDSPRLAGQDSLESGAQGDSDDGSSRSTQNYTQEFQEAYTFAHEKGITTMPTINDANMDGKLTRIAMAKMLSQYAMNVLGQKPENIITPKFNDVSDKQNSDYDDGVTLAYQLGIMGQNMPNNKFRPNDEVTRAEFATALSRMIYHTSDGEYKSTPKYYIHHMEKLVKEGIITKDDPNMKELRGYVMIMLMRSAK